MSHYLGQCASLTGKNYFSNLVSVHQLGTLVGRRIATNLGMSIKSQVLLIKESCFSDNSSIPNKTNRLEMT